MATDAEKLAMLNANQLAAGRNQIAAARADAARLRSFAGAAGGLGIDYSAMAGYQNPELMATTSMLGKNLVGTATGAQTALQRLIALRKSKGYQDQLGGLSSSGGVSALYNPTADGTSTVPVYA